MILAVPMRYRITWTIAAAAIAAVGYFAVNLPALYARVKLDRSFPALSRYVFEPTPEIVLVGSSMAYRLYEGYFSTSVRNLAIGGGSPLTGLAIIASYEQLPRTILVETNIMSRPIDVALVSAFGQSGDEAIQVVSASPRRYFQNILLDQLSVGSREHG